MRTDGQGRTVQEWKLKPSGPDNHWFDCLVGCAVATSICGVKLGVEGEPGPKRQRIRLSDLQRQKR